ncbi:hypothetical protein D0Y65_041560 [Glycine soja]|uniref:Tf2-1-like SH3-like domain-containing protein n=1 Tax=Glycine soja TaxID=3848 RepID=A0A445GW53_GLYSO|nr:hypothetical protein D0Y65_041560 [Glycine soja]
MRFFGPFKILAKVGAVAYKLELPAEARIHNVFHVSQLQLFKGTLGEQYSPLPLTTTESGPIIMPSKLLQVRTLLKGNQKVPQVLVQWEGTDEAEATWENVAEFQANFPNFNLEDKVVLKGDGILMISDKGKLLEGKNDSIETTQQRGIFAKSHVSTMGNRKSGRERKPNSRLVDYVTN